MQAYIIHLLILFSIYGILALSLNLIMGYTGLLSLAHAAFFGIGAYTTAIFTTRYNMNFFLSIIVAMAITMTIAFLFGLVLSKFKGDYYALGSLGFNFIVFATMLNWQELTNGPLGIPGIPRPTIFGISFQENLAFLILIALILALTYFTCQFITDSSFGRSLKAIREDEEALTVFGYKTLNYKLLVFVIGAGMAAVAGSLFASYITYIDPDTFGSHESVLLWSIIILGGLANLRGSLLGALFLILFPEFLRFVGFPNEIAAQMRLLVYGLLLVILMLYRPQGLMGEYKL